MKKIRITKYKQLHFAVRLFLGGLMLMSGATATAQIAGLTVISNQVGSPPSLKFSELKSIFMGEQQRWRSGTKITIALMKTNTLQEKVLQKFFMV